MTNLPGKLKSDPIVEAIFEIRFETEIMPEVLLGKLTTIDTWKDFEVRRLPEADIPSAVRLSNSTLRYAAVLELVNEEAGRLVRLGSNVVAFNNVGKYAGWDIYYSEIKDVLEKLCSNIPDMKVVRLGLRYINVLNETHHYIKDINDLKINVHVGGVDLENDINLNYNKRFEHNHQATVRISTPSMLKDVELDCSVLVDLDLYTLDSEAVKDLDKVISWIDEAHIFEKTEFFKMFSDDVLEKIVEK